MDANCHVEPISKHYRQCDLEKSNLAVLRVMGMGCPNCAIRVQNGLVNLEGVLDASVYLSLEVAEVFYDPGAVSPAQLVEAVAHAGADSRHNYQASLWDVYGAGQAAKR